MRIHEGDRAVFGATREHPVQQVPRSDEVDTDQVGAIQCNGHTSAQLLIQFGQDIADVTDQLPGQLQRGLLDELDVVILQL